MGWTLADIRQKVRKITGRLSPSELTNERLDKYINDFYTLTLPAELKLNYNLTYYNFLTEKNVQKYSVPSGYTNFVPPSNVDGFELDWYQDQQNFFNQNPLGVSRVTIGTGDGSTTNFTYTLSPTPVLQNSIVITDNTETFEDTNTVWTSNNVAITGSAGGTATVNYDSGSVNVSFNTAPANGQTVVVRYQSFQAAKPQSVLYYNNEFTFFPIPDSAYRFTVSAYVSTTALTSATDTPRLEQWGPMIAYGSSRQIHADNGEMGAYQTVQALYEQELIYVLRRTEQDLLNVRSKPSF